MADLSQSCEKRIVDQQRFSGNESRSLQQNRCVAHFRNEHKWQNLCHGKYTVILSAEERQGLQAISQKGSHKSQKVLNVYTAQS